MAFKFKVGDKVRVTDSLLPDNIGIEGVVTRLGGVASTDEGAVVTHESLPSGYKSYGEHGYWFPDKCLELV